MRKEKNLEKFINYVKKFRKYLKGLKESLKDQESGVINQMCRQHEVGNRAKPMRLVRTLPRKIPCEKGMIPLLTEKKGNNIGTIAGTCIVSDDADLMKLSLFGVYFLLESVDICK